MMKRTHSTRRNEIDTHSAERVHSQPLSQPEREQAVIPVLEEELDVRTRRVELEAGVRVEKSVERREECVDEPLTREEVDVERIAVDREVEGPVAVRYEGDTMIVPVLEEVLVVQKRLVLKEEIRITRRRTELHAPQRVVLRREHAQVGRIEEPGSRVAPADARPQGCADPSTESLLDEKRRQQEEVLRKLR
jgi:uncharacterized protein (TIGR02271 family)